MTGAGAKGGFENESELRDLFNSFDPTIFPFVDALGYELSDISKIRATKFESGHKPDIQLNFYDRGGALLGIEKISVKLQSHSSGFNQVDRGWIEERYTKLWPNMSDSVIEGLRLFTGQDRPRGKTRSSNRMYMDELPKKLQSEIFNFFADNLKLVQSDVLAGRGELRAEWFMVTDKSKKITEVREMDKVLDAASFGGVGMTPRGSIRIGRITAQRKGGDKGAKTACHLQFKVNPIELIKAAV